MKQSLAIIGLSLALCQVSGFNKVTTVAVPYTSSSPQDAYARLKVLWRTNQLSVAGPVCPIHAKTTCPR